jgi:hypothetical protein
VCLKDDCDKRLAKHLGLQKLKGKVVLTQLIDDVTSDASQIVLLRQRLPDVDAWMSLVATFATESRSLVP